MALLIVTGTGTEIGKTHIAAAILTHAARGRAVLGYKPIESGCQPGDPASDAARLAAASSFHVKHPPEYSFGAPVSPHLAARLEGRTIDVGRITDRVRALAAEVDLLVVELAGGLFSPIAENLTNADLARALQKVDVHAKTLLVVPDRLGVLHDVGATLRAAESVEARIDGLVLSTPEKRDASTGTNETELRTLTRIPVFGSVPRGAIAVLADAPAIQSILSILLLF